MAWLPISLAAFGLVPAFVLRLTVIHLTPGSEAFLYGAAILGAAFLLTWASEVAQLDIAQGVALAAAALIAVLPEYAVDLYFAWTAASDPTYTSYATANMTGGNRLLIGLAWPIVVYLYWWRSGRTQLELPVVRSVELVFLAIATAYSFVIPIKGTISLWDTILLVGCFVAYMWRTAQSEPEEPELIGPAEALGRLRPGVRRTAVVGLFLYSAGGIVAAAEPFAEALIATGRAFQIDEFLLVQWLAPLASEAPEVIIACLLTFRGDAQAGMGALISSKVNQWTLLIGTLPFAYSIALGRRGALQLDARQVEEILLTAAQSFFAVAVIANLRISVLEVTVLIALFLAQFFFPQPQIRYAFSAVYMTLGTIELVRYRAGLPALLRSGLIPNRDRS